MRKKWRKWLGTTMFFVFVVTTLFSPATVYGAEEGTTEDPAVSVESRTDIAELETEDAAEADRSREDAVGDDTTEDEVVDTTEQEIISANPDQVTKDEVRVCLQLFREQQEPTAGNSSTDELTTEPVAEEPGAGEPLPEAEVISPDLDTVLQAVSSYVLKVDTNPDFTSCWNVTGLARSGVVVPQSYFDTFYKNVITYLKQKNWVLTRTKYSEYSKLIITLTAIGKDARDIMGHNLLSYLADFENVNRQGTNGPIWALMALKSHPSYTIPTDPSAKEQVTEEGLIQCVLNKEIQTTGGWSLDGATADSDLTGMAIQALSSYYGKREDVTAAVDRALAWLSANQYPATGGFGTPTGGTLAETEESTCQVIVALAALGIDPAKDARFIKNGKWPLTGLMQYYLPEGGFMHVTAGSANNGGGAPGVLNGMSTEQGLYTVAAYKRLLQGKTFLYNMSDLTLVKGEEPAGAKDPSGTTEKPGTTSPPQSIKIKVNKVALDYSAITVMKGKSRTLKATVTPSNATTKKLKWTSSNEKIATVSSQGKVTGKKAGTVKITVTATDGSKKKAVCTVKVKALAQTKQLTTKKPAATPKAQTKTLPQAQTKTVASKSSQTSGTGTKTSSGKEDSTDTGWSFDGEDYIPESSSVAEEEEDSTEEVQETTIQQPMNPMLASMVGGATGTLGVLAVYGMIKSGFWRKLRFKKKEQEEEKDD